ncbi:hypothetical protein FAES_3626 [Fibrella aestuarina BUZ 2]|uniref:Uncharacterized protein n=1 Tax=Fibrella aestuarina BUZ 2 TaxID=1166018 RepID=I0KBY0_9BACT|nr:hypothetical protein [Fibrella aestuarina]CCH01633.1 hypothetical protein FAES_3626 [Fibrella aestuarina BUZ 2]
MQYRIYKPSRGFGHLMSYARLGKRQYPKSNRVRLCVEAKTHIPESVFIEQGADAIEISGVSTLPTQQRGSCLGPSICETWMHDHSKTWATMSVADCDQLAEHLFQVGKALFFTSQANEIGEGKDPNVNMNHAEPKCWQVEKGIADRCEAAGLEYSGTYDGDLGAIFMQNVGPDDLASDAAILAWLRRNSPFGKRAFIPHYLPDGTYVVGAAEYMHIVIKCYYTQSSTPAEIVSGTALAGMMVRRGLIALAAEVSEPARKAKILSRKALIFSWPTFFEQFSASGELKTPAPGLSGFNLTHMLAPAPFRPQFGGTLAGMVETGHFFGWDDGDRTGFNPGVVRGYQSNNEPTPYGSTAFEKKNGLRNGNPEGFFGPENPALSAHMPGTYVAGYTAAWPLRPQGNHDIAYEARNILDRIDAWVGSETPWRYASVWGAGDSAYCDASNERTYVRTRYVANRGMGYEYYNAQTGRGAILYGNYSLSASDSEQVKFNTAGGELVITEALRGSWFYFIPFSTT